MCKFYLLIFFIIGAYCDCISPTVKKEITEIHQLNNDILSRLTNLTTNIQTSAKETCVSVADNQMFDLDKLQKNLTERTEQIIDQKFASISEVFQKFRHQLDSIQNILQNLTLKKEAQNLTLQKEAQNLTLQMKAQNLTLQMKAQNSTLQMEAQNFTEDCTDVFNLGETFSTSYLIQKYDRKVVCDMETDGGGWLLIQRRRKLIDQVDFNRDWASYKEGFGDLDTEFWIGNKFLHRITNQKSYELRIDMETFDKKTFYATYSEFQVENEASGYKLHLGEYEGNATDGLKYNNKQKFLTFDRDHGDPLGNCAKYHFGGFWFRRDHGDPLGNCAKYHFGGFWFRRCGLAYLNGVFQTGPVMDYDKSIRWHRNREWLILIKVEMKIRPKK